MCGIIGVTTLETFTPVSIIVRRGLEKLEYRGYDSVGIASIHHGMIIVKKAKGKIADVSRALKFDDTPGNTVIGHTRWATHGRPSDENAHPHVDCKFKIAIVHNGIIQNFLELKKELESKGHKFRSETDTEVIAHLIEDEYNDTGNLLEALRRVTSKIKGSYALGIISVYTPNTIYFAKKDSPLIIGLTDKMKFIASDIPAFLEYTNEVIVLRDGELGYITPNEVYIEHHGKPVDWRGRVFTVSWTAEDAARKGYPHFMLKEIHEQPVALRETLWGISREVEEAAKLLLESKRIFITAAGTSYHAGLIGEYFLRRYAKTVPIVFIASEHRGYEGVIDEDDVLIAISQSGETIDTLMAVRMFKEVNAKVIAISNVIGSAIPRESDASIYTRAGPEIGVAATKTFTTQALTLELLALTYAKVKGSLNNTEYNMSIKILEKAGEATSKTISMVEGLCKRIGEIIATKSNTYYLSRGLGVPIAMEGALKLKEISYIHAEAYPAGESKHGPIALIEEGFPAIYVILNDYTRELMVGNVMEFKARGALTIGLIPEGDTELKDLIDFPIEIEYVHPLLSPLTYTPPLQLIAYYAAVKRGYDPDKPRNLAKTVTVE